MSICIIRLISLVLLQKLVNLHHCIFFHSIALMSYLPKYKTLTKTILLHLYDHSLCPMVMDHYILVQFLKTGSISDLGILFSLYQELQDQQGLDSISTGQKIECLVFEFQPF